jgi:hypothetical protein
VKENINSIIVPQIAMIILLDGKMGCFDWNALSAISNAITAAGVILALWQLWITKTIAQLQFEDSLAREYRDLVARIPTRVFYGAILSEGEYRQSRDEFFRYIDLSNEQVALRKRNRVSRKVWVGWCEGIECNLSLPAFRKVWDEVKDRTSSFEELRMLERLKFKTDPKLW